MKIYSNICVFISLLSLLTVSRGFGQTCSDSPKTALGSTVGVWDWRSTNITNWTAHVRAANNPNQYQDITMPSPFVNNPNLNDNTSRFERPEDPAEKDFHPEDGWELLVMNFGRPINDLNNPDNPYFVLYNRYRGLMRVFIYIVETPPTGVTSAQIDISFDKSTHKNSGLLSYLTVKADALDDFKKNIVASVPNYYSTGSIQLGQGMWLAGDFPVAYDPCTCELGVNSQGVLTPNLTIVSIQPQWITESDVTLNGITNETTKPITASGEPKNSENGFSALIKQGSEAIESGSKVYDNVEKFGTGLSKFLKSFKKKDKGTPVSPFLFGSVKKEEAEEKLPSFLKGLPEIGFVFGVLEFLITGGTKKEASASQAVPLKEYKSTFTGNIQTTGNLRGGEFYTPGYLDANAISDTKPTYNNTLGVFNLLETPTLEFVEYKCQYTLLEHQDLGLNIIEAGICAASGQSQSSFRALKTPVVRQYKLKNPIQYVLNPAADVDIVDMQAAWIYKINDAHPTPVPNTLRPKTVDTEKCFTDIRYSFIGPPLLSYVDPVKSVDNSQSPPVYVLKSPEETIAEALDNSGVFIESYPKDQEGNIDGTADFRKVVFTTGYTPLECLGNNNFMFGMYKGGDPETAHLVSEPEIYLKLRIIMRPKHATPETENVIMVVTYNTKNEPHETAFYPANSYSLKPSESASNPANLYPNSDIFSFDKEYNIGGFYYVKDYWVGDFTSAISGSAPAFPQPYAGVPFDLVLDGNTTITNPETTLVAINTITINDGFTVPDNVKLTLIAGKEVIINPNFVSPTDFLAYVGLPPSFSACEALPTPQPVSAADITKFCREKYKPYSDQKRADDVADAAPTKKPLPSAPALSVYPNPMQGGATATVDLPADTEARLVLRDVTGRVVATVWAPGTVAAGRYTLPLDAATIAGGVYGLTLETPQYQKTLKVSIVK